MMRRPPTTLRLPVEPLRGSIDRVGGAARACYIVAGRYGIALDTVQRQWTRARIAGFSIGQADRWALALGTHPALCWGDAFYQPLVSERRRRAA